MLPVNPHPPIVMFAPSLGCVCIVLRLIHYFRKELVTEKLQFLFITLFFIATTASYYSGYFGAEFASKLAPETIKTHQGYGKFSLILLLPTYFFGALSLLNEQQNRAVALIYDLFLLLVTALLIYSSHLGGKIVFEHGGGVRGIGYESPFATSE